MMTQGNEQHIIVLGRKFKAFLKGISTVRPTPEMASMSLWKVDQTSFAWLELA
jgi:hypothetical protein